MAVHNLSQYFEFYGIITMQIVESVERWSLRTVLSQPLTLSVSEFMFIIKF